MCQQATQELTFLNTTLALSRTTLIKMGTSLGLLPAEIVQIIATFLDYLSEINALCRAQRRFYEFLNPYLYKLNFRIGDHFSQALTWAATHGLKGTALNTITAGETPSTLHLGLAARHGHDGLVTFFHKRGVNVNGHLRILPRERYFLEETSPDWPPKYTPLALAAEHGHDSVVQLLLSYGADIELGSSDHGTPLMLAAGAGHASIVKALAHAGASIRAQDASGFTPLYFAARGGHTEIVRFLIGKGAGFSPWMQSEFSFRSPVAPAIDKGRVEILQCLLDNGARIGVETFSRARRPSQPDALRILGKHLKFPKEARNIGEQTRFAVAAAACGLTDLLNETISMGWDVNLPDLDDQGWTALEWAATNGHLDAVCLLLKYDAHPDGRRDFNSASANSGNPLLNAVKQNYEEMVRLLLEQGANVNVRDRDAEILFYAIRNPSIFKTLLDYGATPNGFKRLTYETLTVHAIEAGQADVLELLMDRGVDFPGPSMTFGGETLPVIYSMSNEAVLDVFVQHEVIPGPGNGNGHDTNIVHWAVARGNLPLLRYLVSRGFDLLEDGWLTCHITVATLHPNIEKARAILDFLRFDQGLDIDSVDDQSGETALLSVWSQAEIPGDGDAPIVLLERGARPCYVSPSGNFPLLAAANTEGVPLSWVRALLDAIGDSDVHCEVFLPQVKAAIGVLEDKGSNGAAIVKMLRHYYWHWANVVRDREVAAMQTGT
ncbi:hypothetical protein HK57_00514 [Aspergillus ustus]|uniref:Uncharacterized protein n=1 Tax=Aspergillus ustus TaxID=40382 RepID=A0A0C1E6H0_ASPUT|nr:hypothetical protein HK57_00514 [Aspergillus ustus]